MPYHITHARYEDDDPGIHPDELCQKCWGFREELEEPCPALFHDPFEDEETIHAHS